MERTEALITFLEACITPVALISGVGLLLLTVTNRLGRTIDRTRILVGELEREGQKRREEKLDEMKIMYKRSRMLRLSIAFITLSIISSSLLIPLLAWMTLSTSNLNFLGYLFFSISFFSILVAALFFFMDITITLKALNIEVKQYVNRRPFL